MHRSPSRRPASHNSFSFPWQGALLVLLLTAGAAVHTHPSLLYAFAPHAPATLLHAAAVASAR